MRIAHIGLLLLTLLGGLGAVSAAQQPPIPDPTQVAGTLQALVDARFTATAAAQLDLTLTAVSGESLESTADALFEQALTATAGATDLTLAPSQTATPAPTATPRGELTSLGTVDSRALVSAYRALISEGYRAARDQFDDLIEQSPGIAEAHVGRGITYLDQGLHRQALSDFQQAAALIGDDDAYLQYRMAEVYSKILNRERALEILNPLIERLPLTEFYLLRAEIHYDLGDFEAFVEDYTAAMAISQSPVHIGNFFEFLVTRVIPSPGEWAFDAANFYGALAVGIGYARAGNTREALNSFDNAIRVATGDFDDSDNTSAPVPQRIQYQPPGIDAPLPIEWVYYQRAFMHYQNGDRDLAQDDIDLALQIAPSFPYALVLHIVLNSGNGDPEDVYLKLMRIGEANPHMPYLAWDILYFSRNIGIFGGAPPDIITHYLQSLNVRRVTVISHPTGRTTLPYITNGWAYTMPLPGEPGDTLRIRAESSPIDGVDPLIAVVDAGGTLAANDDEASSLNSELTVTLGDQPATLLIGAYYYDLDGQIEVIIERRNLRGNFVPLQTETPDPLRTPPATRSSQSLDIWSTATDLPPTNTPPPTRTPVPTITRTPSPTLEGTPTRNPRPTRTEVPGVTVTPSSG